MKRSWHSYQKVAPKPDRTGSDGFVYDSKTEMRRGEELRLLEKAGVISDLVRQKKFPLEFSCSCGAIKVLAGERVAQYRPDFVYMAGGIQVIEDVKGYPDETSKFRIRVFEALYKQRFLLLNGIDTKDGKQHD
jgi:hypothetical protein